MNLKKILTITILAAISSSSAIYAKESTDAPHIRELNGGSNKTVKMFANVEINKSYHARRYNLGPNDVVNVTVMGSTELTQPGVRVQPDGKISLIYIQDLNVTGMSIEQLQSVIKTKYSEYLVNPQVSVTLTQSRPFIVYISGAIYNPGSYELNTITNSTPYSSKPETFIERKTPLLSNVIVAAGGISYDADFEHVQIKNEIDGTDFEVNLFDLLQNANSEQDVYLMSGDKIVVPRLVTPFAVDDQKYKLLAKSTFFQREIPVRVLGYVNNPGLLSLNSSESGNLNSAIAAAGGYVSNAAYIPKKVYLSRVDNNSKLITRTIDPRKEDIALMPNDVIYVPDKLRPTIGRGFDYMLRVLAPFYTFSSTYDMWDSIRRR